MSELTLDDARRVTAAAEGKALELGCAVTITVTDAGGHVRAQARLEGARFGTLNVSTNSPINGTPIKNGAPRNAATMLTRPATATATPVQVGTIWRRSMRTPVAVDASRMTIPLSRKVIQARVRRMLWRARQESDVRVPTRDTGTF